MTRKFKSFKISSTEIIKRKLLNYGNKFSNFCFLDNNNYQFNKSYETIAGIGLQQIVSTKNNVLSDIDLFLNENKDWVFGHLNYDLKNQIEELNSKNIEQIGFPDFVFFVPEIVVILEANEISIGVDCIDDAEKIFQSIMATVEEENSFSSINLKSKFSKQEYLDVVAQLQNHLQKGDCYEICFCQEFFQENVNISPISVFEKLNQLSPNPFSAFYKYENAFLLSASPERFLAKRKDTIFSQPIKGTLKRRGNTEEDLEKERATLLNDPKERAENTMIVDLVRNDLSKVCEKGSVYVKEFLGIYSFPQVHQMISTIEGKVNSKTNFSSIIQATFPMGSMTGAPKIRAMELIEQYERSCRGLFSGSVGYISPDGDFDFNVVIRSILYNAKAKYLSIQTGSAITLKSSPEKEYEECLVKLEAMKKAIG